MSDSADHSRQLFGRQIEATILVLVALLAGGCFSNSYHWELQKEKYVVVEHGRVRQLQTVYVGKWATGGNKWLERREDVKPSTASADADVPSLPSWWRMNQSLLRQIDFIHGYRSESFLPYKANHLNREFGQGECFILGTAPLILGFPESINPVAEEQAWQQRVDYGSWPAEHRGDVSSHEPSSTRTSRLLSPDELGTKIGSVVIYPDWSPLSLERYNGECEFDEGDATLIMLKTPTTVGSLFAAPDFIAAVKALASDQISVAPRHRMYYRKRLQPGQTPSSKPWLAP